MVYSFLLIYSVQFCKCFIMLWFFSFIKSLTQQYRRPADDTGSPEQYTPQEYTFGLGSGVRHPTESSHSDQR